MLQTRVAAAGDVMVVEIVKWKTALDSDRRRCDIIKAENDVDQASDAGEDKCD